MLLTHLYNDPYSIREASNKGQTGSQHTVIGRQKSHVAGATTGKKVNVTLQKNQKKSLCKKVNSIAPPIPINVPNTFVFRTAVPNSNFSNL